MKRLVTKLITAGFVLVFGLGTVAAQSKPAQSKPDSLRSGFDNPPQSANPRVWWHWMNGNITKEGIKLDLEWMHSVGIAGFQNFDANLTTPQVVTKRLPYMSPGWKDAFKYATVLADQLGMEEAIAGSPGWSESGGPWVPASQGMKKYVWSETFVEGGRPFTGRLAHPPTVTGAFQNLIRHDEPLAPGVAEPQFYADSAVVAYRRPASDVPLAELHPKITASAGEPDIAMLSDGDLEKTTKLPIPAVGQSAWIQYEFAAPTAIRALTYVMRNPDRGAANRAGYVVPLKTLEASDDGVSFRTIVDLPDRGSIEHTLAFPAVTAKYFRVAFKRPTFQSPNAAAEGANTAAPIADYQIAELVLHPGARVNRFEEKGAFTTAYDLYGFATPAMDPADAIARPDVIDLTAKMSPDGTLNWTPPPGDWVVLRFGYSLLGITNHPATPEATGLEVDKLDRRYVKNYMENYLDSYKQTVGPELIGKRGLRYVINDSWEAGSQNWTDNMIAQFRKLRGYDPVPWMPVLAGHVVESAAASDRFLWDFRETIGDLITTEHYGQLEATLHEWGMGHYGESHEGGRAFVADGMAVKKYNEVPMGALWTQTPGVVKEQYGYNADDRESASVAHIYGQNLAAAESLTTCTASSAWAWSPGTLKPFADAEFTNGINRFVIHESAHQPLVNKAPGLTLGPCGQWFNRNETWATQAGPWIKYLTRTSYLLQQGHFGADLIYFYGEDSNLTAIFANKAPNVPAGYGFDYVNADALMHELSVAGGRIVTPSGMNYRVLGLDPYSQHMSLPVLRAIHKLVMAGAIVAGPKPMDDPSLADDQAEFNKLNNELFGDGTGVHTVGKGTIYAGQDLGEVFSALHVAPDFDYTKPESNTRLIFVHRKLAEGDLYFVDNRNNRTELLDATFRVTGKAPELWHSDTGKTEPVSFTIADGRTTVPLKLEPWGSVFVVFLKPTRETTRTLPATTETQLAVVDGVWTLSFQPGRGAPASILVDNLFSWSDSSKAGVKFFSGTGTYTNTIQARPEWFKNHAHLWLDLGDVKNLAEVNVNGKPLGIVWHAPYRVDATAALRPGANQITIKVTNAWVNRLIGDQQPDAVQKYTFTTEKPYKANSPLQASGLLGPVTLDAVTVD
jgi:hypothetical protein